MSDAPSRDWAIRRYQVGDEVAILALFNRVFGLHRSLEHWRWQFRDNPYAGPFASQARRRSDDALVGTHIVMPFQLNVRGAPVLAAQTLDLVVDPDYRRQGIFEAAARDCFASFPPADVRAVVAFPNASSYPGFVRSLGWMRLIEPTRFTLKLDLEAELVRAVRLRPLARALNAAFRAWRRRGFVTERAQGGPALEYRTSRSVPDGYDALWDSVRTGEVLSFWKDSKYFRWRYDANPDHEFTYHFLSRPGGIGALAVTVEQEGSTTLCELVVSGRDVAMGKRLVREICAGAFERRSRAIRFLGHDRGYFATVLEGFRFAPAPENVFVGRALDDPELNERMSRAENWTLTFGDADFV